MCRSRLAKLEHSGSDAAPVRALRAFDHDRPPGRGAAAWGLGGLSLSRVEFEPSPVSPRPYMRPRTTGSGEPIAGAGLPIEKPPHVSRSGNERTEGYSRAFA